MMAYGCILTALRHRDNTGEGQWIDTSLLDGQVATMSYHGTGYLATGNEPRRMGSAHPSLTPYQSFPSSDGFFILGCANQGLWERMCHAIERPGLLKDPRFSTNTDRVEHRAECVEVLSEVFRTKPTEHWVKLIADAGIPCGPINRVSQVLNDPQVLSRDMVVEIPHPEVPDLKVPGSPLKLTATPPTFRRHPPLLGQHNEEILAVAGYNQTQTLI